MSLEGPAALPHQRTNGMEITRRAAAAARGPPSSPSGHGFVAPRDRPYGWLHPDLAPWHGINESVGNQPGADQSVSSSTPEARRPASGLAAGSGPGFAKIRSSCVQVQLLRVDYFVAQAGSVGPCCSRASRLCWFSYAGLAWKRFGGVLRGWGLGLFGSFSRLRSEWSCTVGPG
jgi:hypothetical protein